MPNDNENYWNQPMPYSQAPAGEQPARQPYASPVPAAGQYTAQPVSANAADVQPEPQAAAQPVTGAQHGETGAQGGSAPVAPSTQPAAAQGGVAAKKGHGWIVAIVAIVCLFAFLTIAVSSCTSLFGSRSYGAGYNDVDGPAVAVIDISGTIQYDGSACSPEGLKELLDEAEDDDQIVAVVLRVDSGGGTATAGEEMATYVDQFSKPIVVSSASINASAAYEISSQADYIYVARSTEIGAIGTALEITDLSGLLEKLGIRMDTITSSDEKDSSYGFRPLTDEERAYYQDMVNQINSVFIENVAEGRGMTVSQVNALATGMPFTGMDAVKNGLADEIGTREDAIDKAAELAGVSDYTVVSLSFTYYDLTSLYDLLSEDKISTEQLTDALEELGNGKRIH